MYSNNKTYILIIMIIWSNDYKNDKIFTKTCDFVNYQIHVNNFAILSSENIIFHKPASTKILF